MRVLEVRAMHCFGNTDPIIVGREVFRRSRLSQCDPREPQADATSFIWMS